MIKIHELKTVNPYFEETWEGNKTFEVRQNDRYFKTRDLLILREYKGETQSYLTRYIIVQITYILNNPLYVKEGFVILATKILTKSTY